MTVDPITLELSHTSVYSVNFFFFFLLLLHILFSVYKSVVMRLDELLYWVVMS